MLLPGAGKEVAFRLNYNRNRFPHDCGIAVVVHRHRVHRTLELQARGGIVDREGAADTSKSKGKIDSRCSRDRQPLV